MARKVVVLGVASIAASLAIAAACKREEAAPAARPASTSPALAEKPFYRLDAVPVASCTAGSTCEAKVVLTALGAYHVNQEYPFKFLPDAASPLAGDAAFAHDDAKHGTMTLKFQPAAAGTTTLTGTFKLSVCSDDTCEIEKPQITVRVAVN